MITKYISKTWFKEHCDPYKDKALPEAPEDMRVELARRYVEIYEKLSGRTITPPPFEHPINRIIKNLKA